MKKIYLFKMFLMAFVLMLLGGVNASAEEVSLSKTNIYNGGTGAATSYGEKTLTDEKGNTWKAYAIRNFHSKATNTQYYLQIKKYSSNTAYYIQVPALGSKITKIEMTVSGSNKKMTDGGNSATLFFSNKNSTSSSEETGVASGTGGSSVTIDASSLNLNSGYITADGAVRIWDVKVTYETSSTPTTNFKYSAIEYNAVLGGTNTFPTLTNDYDTEVTYNSSNPSVATIDTEGNINLEGVGTTTITATLKADNKITASYTLNVEKLTNSITFSNGTNTYVKAPVSVELSASVAGSTIYYSTDGNKPPKDDAHKYSSAINITKSGTVLKVLATAVGIDDAEAEAKYTIKPAQPVFSEDSKTFKKPLNVTLSLPETTDNTSKIYYAIGKNATAESMLYDGSPITIDAPNDGDKVILHAVVVDEYGNVGTEKRCTYTKTTVVVFDFTANPWGITPGGNSTSNTDGKELPVDGVVLTTTSGSGSKTCIYSGSPITLRVYTGGTLKFTAPAGYELSKIVFTGSITCTFDSGNLSNKIWTATKSVNSVVFSRTGTTEIKTATISLVPATIENKTLVATDSDGAYYSTFSCDRAVVFTEDVNVYAVNVTEGKLELAELTKGNYKTTNSTTKTVTNGYYVTANTGVLISAKNANITYYTAATGQDHASLPNNQLVAATADGMFTGDTDHFKYYKLAYDDYVKKTGLGFYYGAANGDPFEVKKGLAYLAVPVISGGNLAAGYSFGGNGGDDTTGINGIENDNVNETQTIYNLQGQRVEKAGLRGIYIVNGKKVVLK